MSNGFALPKSIGFDVMVIMAIVVLMAVLFMPCAARADESDLTVYGTSIVSAAPDYALITAGYSADNPDVRKAQEETAQKMDAILKALRELGIEDKDIVTSNFSVETMYNYREDVPKIVGYRVTNNVTITVWKIGEVADVLNAVFEAGSNQSYGLTFKTTKEGEMYRQALSNAIKIAKEKADVMAEAAGCSLGSIQSIKEIQSGYAPTPVYGNSRATGVAQDAASKLGDTIMSGSLDITAQVELHFVVK